MSKFAIIVRRASHELQIDGKVGKPATGENSTRSPYHMPSFLGEYMYLSEFWGAEASGVYRIEKVANINQISFTDISLDE